MSRATELVGMCGRWREARGGDRGGDPGGEGGKAEDEAFSNLLHTLGIPDPVTRRSSGAAYHHQVSCCFPGANIYVYTYICIYCDDADWTSVH